MAGKKKDDGKKADVGGGEGGKGGKGGGGGGDKDAGGKEKGGAKGAQSINVRHILVRHLSGSYFLGGFLPPRLAYLPEKPSCLPQGGWHLFSTQPAGQGLMSEMVR